MENSNVYQQAEDALLEDMDGELLLYHPPTAITLHLNGPSAVVWQLCDGERSLAEIIRVVEEAYPQQADQIASDVRATIVDLCDRKVLTKIN